MEALSLSELKGLCQKRGLTVSGTKGELIERLVRGSSSGSSRAALATAKGEDGAASAALFPSDYDALTIPQLKDLCRERVLPVGGIKDDIVARLKASDPRNMTLVQLKERCRDAALPVTGTKADLVDRVMASMSSGTTALLQTKSVDELKDLCRERGVAVTGKKDELVDRLKQAWSAAASSAATASSKTTAKPSTEKSSSSSDAPKKSKAKAASTPSYVFMTIPQLKELCREKKLPVGGTKDELVDRLTTAGCGSTARPSSASKASNSSTSTGASTSVTTTTTTTDSGYEGMMVPQLKDLCRSRTLPVMGTKDELVKRLKEHDDVVRAMFKKRKSPSSDSISTSNVSAPVSSSGKRRAGEDEPKAKKAKTGATKAGSASLRPPTAKNVGAFAMPATSSNAAGKSALAKQTKASTQTKHANGRYLVYSTCAYPPDRFHSYAGPGEPTYHGSFPTKQEANDRANKLFYHNNPWGLGKDEMDDNHDIDEDWKDGLLRLEVCPPDSEQWVVGVKDIGTVGNGSSASSTARKSPPANAKKSSPMSSKWNGRYLVYSTCAYPPDGFHSYAGPGEPTYHGSFLTKDEANDRVNTLFYHNNPWGLDADEMDHNYDIDEDWKDGLLRMEVCPPDSEHWVVGVKDIGAPADNDGDVIMISGSDTEDE